MSGRRVAVTFALPDEGRDFIRRLENRSAGRGPLAPITGTLGGCDVTVVFTGVGDGADCQERLQTALATRPELLIASGFGGGLTPGLAVGDIVIGENYSDPGWATTASESLGCRRVTLTTQPLLAETVLAKAQLAAATGADAVDMETGWIAARCRAAGIPMLSVRVISDAWDQDFPAPGAVLFDVARQRPRYVRLPLWLLTHPWRIASFVRFVRGLTPARQRLAVALALVVEG